MQVTPYIQSHSESHCPVPCRLQNPSAPHSPHCHLLLSGPSTPTWRRAVASHCSPFLPFRCEGRATLRQCTLLPRHSNSRGFRGPGLPREQSPRPQPGPGPFHSLASARAVLGLDHTPASSGNACSLPAPTRRGLPHSSPSRKAEHENHLLHEVSCHHHHSPILRPPPTHCLKSGPQTPIHMAISQNANCLSTHWSPQRGYICS